MIVNNCKKIDQLTKLIDEKSEEILKRGKYGKLVITLKIHDGSIQEIESQVIEKHR